MTTALISPVASYGYKNGLVPTHRLSRTVGLKSFENVSTSTGSASIRGAAGYTLSKARYFQLTHREKRMIFRGALLYAAKKALQAGNITQAQYVLLLKLYQHPWVMIPTANTNGGKWVDALDLVRQYISKMSRVKANDSTLKGAYIVDWSNQKVNTAGTYARDWLADTTSNTGVMKGTGTNPLANGLLWCVTSTIAGTLYNSSFNGTLTLTY